MADGAVVPEALEAEDPGDRAVPVDVAPEDLAVVPEDLEAAAPEAGAAAPDRSVLPDNEAVLRERHRFLTGWNLGFGDIALFSICPG